MKEYDFIVVGLGAMGSATIYNLAAQGYQVLGIDRFKPPHSMGSSHGKTRIIREAYFEHPIYVPLVQYAYEKWQELESQSQQRLLWQIGGLMMGKENGVLVPGAKKSADLHELPYKMLTPAEIRKQYPQFHPDDDMVGIWEPRTGVLSPEKCIQGYLELAKNKGASLEYNAPVTSWEESNGNIIVSTKDARYSAKKVVFASGAWLPILVPELKTHLQVERQYFLWLQPPENEKYFSPDNCPIHIWEYEKEKFMYGFPIWQKTIKVAFHHNGVITSVDEINREISEEEVAAVRGLVKKYIPELNSELNDKQVCMYTNTQNSHFLIDYHPQHKQVLIASPCSGHGFKFASALGEIFAHLLTNDSNDLSSISIANKKFDLSLFSWEKILQK